MAHFNFAAVKAKLGANNILSPSTCIGNAVKSDPTQGPCARRLGTDRIQLAMKISLKTDLASNIEHIRDLECLLLCWKCQVHNYNRKDQLEYSWGDAFPKLALSTPGRRQRRVKSPYSLYRKPQPSWERDGYDSATGNSRSNQNINNMNMQGRTVERGLSPPSKRTRQRSTCSFLEPGPRSFAPWTLRKDVVDLLCDPLPDTSTKYPDGGSIYIVPAGLPSTSCKRVKIGITKGPTRRRIQQISYQHGIDLDSSSRDWEWCPGPVLEKLEKVVHQDLAFSKSDVEYHDGSGPHSPREYFDLDFCTACDIVKLFRDIMASIGLEPGGVLDVKLKGAILAQPRFQNMDRNLVLEDWQLANSSHRERIAFWRSVFKLDREWYELPLPFTPRPDLFCTFVMFLGVAKTISCLSLKAFGSWLMAVMKILMTA